MGKNIKSLSLLFLILTSTLFAQTISRQEIDVINDAVSTSCGTEYGVSCILPMDRSNNQMGQFGFDISDTYSTLKDCFIFVANKKDSTDNINTYGLIGIFKNGSILWKSNPVIKCPFFHNTEIAGVMDLNKDGYIDIITFWNSGNQGDISNIWILSWNGSNGWFINEIDSSGTSSIGGLENDLNILDRNGDGIWEICANSGCYSWNGSLYGDWDDDPYPKVIPKNKLVAEVSCNIIKVSDGYKYEYTIKNDTNSLQKIVLFGIDNQSENVDNFIAPLNWHFSIFGGFNYLVADIKIPEWDYPEAFINPGERKDGYTFVSKGLPQIANIYIQGYNTLPDLDEDKIKANSFVAKTLSSYEPSDNLINVMDSLITFIYQSRKLEWIRDSLTADKYDSLFTIAKNQLQQNNIAGVKTILNQILLDVDQDSTSNLTSEAYALIKYNTEFLIAHLNKSGIK